MAKKHNKKQKANNHEIPNTTGVDITKKKKG